MARPKQKQCTNCNGSNPKCHYLESGRKCRVGKAVSQATKKKIDRREKFLEHYYQVYFTFLDIFNITSEEVGFYKYLRTQNKNLAQYYYRKRQGTVKKIGGGKAVFTKQELKEIKEINQMVTSAEEVKRLAEQSEKERKEKLKAQRKNI